MESFITSRTSHQCRSHHIKIIRTFKSISLLVNKFKNSMGVKEYKEKLIKLKEEFPILDENSE